MKSVLIDQWTQLIENELQNYFSDKDPSCAPLEKAMEYSLLAGGKRIRPILVMMACHAAGSDPTLFVNLAIAPEMLHTYSLIHDDLPSMDDDDLRRGQPTSHKVFGEATAILAGDALHSEAFEILLSQRNKSVSTKIQFQIALEFCQAIGRKGMVAGQVMDLQAEHIEVDLQHLNQLHSRKTGALIRFCSRMGGFLAGADTSKMNSLTLYAEKLGLLFQVVDDLLDRSASVKTFGKTPGKDLAQEKATFPKLIGEKETGELADKLLQECHSILAKSQLKTGLLTELADFVRSRDY